MPFSVMPVIGLSLLLAIPAQAATVYRCVVEGVPTYQDTPCTTTPPHTTDAAPHAQVRVRKQLALEERKRELVRELRVLTLQHRQVAESLGGEPSLQGDRAAHELRRAQVDQDHARREAQIRFKINGIDEQLVRLKRP